MSLPASSELKIENDWSSERQQACLIDRVVTIIAKGNWRLRIEPTGLSNRIREFCGICVQLWTLHALQRIWTLNLELWTCSSAAFCGQAFNYLLQLRWNRTVSHDDNLIRSPRLVQQALKSDVQILWHIVLIYRHDDWKLHLLHGHKNSTAASSKARKKGKRKEIGIIRIILLL